MADKKITPTDPTSKAVMGAAGDKPAIDPKAAERKSPNVKRRTAWKKV
jgi:hypothetical protein